ncbi:hypothetical protein AGDE_09557 [Angomonas deanei]|uniref:Complex 1 protein (LYR family), putative n=1 Tax=Angomonas deanei TaxID=59799 RepID=A0A7G2CD05_9TRYP|nr:hypothetical protein AGDE_09557 [Angomonas deanei]CAD2217708.1 Complex 1 protein (LYR family), putative [Angomonas deanei]|eukprot:EPY30212.1 hypothetical protein AGDE_09557 [Angomonas deanei]
MPPTQQQEYLHAVALRYFFFFSPFFSRLELYFLSSMSATQAALAKVRSRMIKTARGFHDYNFRTYFVNHIKDDFTALAAKSTEEQKAFLAKDARKQLKEMQRMVLVSRLYADNRKVFVDRNEKDASPPPASKE